MRQGAGQSRGFTLLELILVMMVMCVALAMVAPSLREFRDSAHSDDAARQLLAMLRFAQTQAIADGRVYRLHINYPEPNQYQLLVQDLDAFVDLELEFGRVFTLPEDMRATLEREYDGGEDYIEFFPSGRTEQAVIRLSDGRDRETLIACQSPTEMFRILSEEDEEEARP